jgi:hypothetical protein
MAMRGLVLVCVLAACNDPGLLLEVHAAGDAPMASVEVMIPDNVHGGGMGMPPKQSARTGGKVYEVIDTTAAEVSDGTAKVLLQAGSIDAVPALLVVGKDGNGAINGYALITDPNSSDGLIHVRHTRSDEVVVHLDPVAQMPAVQARMPAQTDRLARWSKNGDSNDGRCIGIIHADGRGDFFGPKDDTDCDGADPECDDAWYLKSAGAGACATQEPPTNDDTMDACRIGMTPGCTDNDPTSGKCMVVPESMCVPVTICEQCDDPIDMACLDEASPAMNEKTTYIDCTIYINTSIATGATLCPATGSTSTVSLHGFIGDGWSCAAVPGFIQELGNAAAPMQTTPLAGTTDSLAFMCPQPGSQGIDVALVGVSDEITDPMMPTTGGLLFSLHDGNTTAPLHTLGLPFVAHFVAMPDGNCPADPTMTCSVVPGTVNGGDPYMDEMWHCAGS